MPYKELTLEQIHNFKGKFPKQLWYLALSEMWERFCFYGMRGMLTLFMVDQLFMTDQVAISRYASTQAYIYIFTFIGGLFADKIIGFRKSLFWGGIMMILGSAILALGPFAFGSFGSENFIKEFAFFLGLSFTVVGTGFFKPNISTMVGLVYRDGDNRRDAGFSLFYAGINMGALIGGALCVYVGKHYSWHLAFGFAGIVMAISLLTFIFTQHTMGPIGFSPLRKKVVDGKIIDQKETAEELLEEDPRQMKVPAKDKWKEYVTYLGSLAVIPLIYILIKVPEYTNWFMGIVGPVVLIYFFFEWSKYKGPDRKKLIAALLFILFSVLFWGIYEQAGGSMSLFAARNLNDTFAGTIKMDPNSVNNGANSLFVIIFAFVASFVWLALAKHKKEPNTVVKFGLGFIFLGLGYALFYALRYFSSDAGLSSLNIFILAYFVVTLGELCLSPIGLSIMTKLSPKPMQGMMMGFWFLASGYGQYVAGLLSKLIPKDQGGSNFQKMLDFTGAFGKFAIYALIAGVILVILSPFVKKLMQEVR